MAALTLGMLLSNACKKPTGSPAAGGSAAPGLAAARAGFATTLIKQESEDEAAPAPPQGVFNLISYTSPAGKLPAYLSPDPGDGKKHPLVIWLTGGFSNSISEIAWEDDIPVENDQSASAYRKAGLAMMYPSLRGGNDNPGFKEGLYGEVDDVLAAAAHAAALPWVDPSRIYLGGHSTGGTLALLVAAAAPEGRFRAVISFGPADETAGYGQENVPFDVHNAKERRLRAPVEFLNGISSPTLVIEGEEGNKDSIDRLRKRNRNPKLGFVTAKGQGHFSVLGPTNGLLAAKILGDKGPACNIRLTEAEIQAACSKAKEANTHPAGDIREDYAPFGVVFYYTPKPKADPDTELRKALAAELPGIPVVPSFKDAPEPPFVMLTEEKAPLNNYPVPDAGYFKSSGRGMSDDDIKGIQATEIATIAVLVTPADGVWKRANSFNRVVHAFATSTGAFIWDSATRECFHRDAWKKTRIDDWGSAEIADLRSQVTIHNYPRDDGSGHMRAITLGMEKFALPDVAIEQFTAFDRNQCGNLINIFCQTIAADPVLKDPAHFPVSIDKLIPPNLRDYYRASLKEKAEGKAVIAVVKGTPDEGDTDNAQVALDFRHGEGATDDERRSSLLARMWGSSDAIVAVKHDGEIEKASAAAKLKLAAMKETFRKGLEPGAHLLVKGGFPRDDEGKEWMWVEVLKWSDGDVLSGVLQNDPFYIKDLKAGASVSVKLDEAFDYLLENADGSTEGNKTGELMEKQQKAKEEDKKK